MPKVSIVLPTYNGSKYIRESIDSILKQSFSDWELILVNDCSTDETLGILMDYEQIDKRIRVINNKENKRLPASLNIGFEVASGRYLTWTSDDNKYDEAAIEKMVSCLDENLAYPMVVARMAIIDEDNNLVCINNTFSNEKMFCDNNVGACFMYRREASESIGKYRTDCFLAEDYEYWLRMNSNCGDFWGLDEVLYEYRVHRASLSNRRSEVMEKTADIKCEYFELFYSKLKNKPSDLLYYYINLKSIGKLTDYIAITIKESIPQLKQERPLSNKEIIIYGAGKKGDDAFKRLSGLVAFYADKDISKVGQKKNGLEIISVENMLSLQSDYQVCIAIYEKNIYSAICELLERGLKEYVLIF